MEVAKLCDGVPYVGAEKDVDLGDHKLKVGTTGSGSLVVSGSSTTLNASILGKLKVNALAVDALLVEQTGIFNNTFVVDTNIGAVGINKSPSATPYCLDVVGLTKPGTSQGINLNTGAGMNASGTGFQVAMNAGILTLGTTKGGDAVGGSFNVGGNSGSLSIYTGNGGAGTTVGGSASNITITAGIGYPGGSPGSNGDIVFRSGNTQIALFMNNINRIGNFGLGVSLPNAILHLKAGTAAAYTAPLMFTSGVNLTAPAAGALEFTTDDLYFTITTGTARKMFIFNDGTKLTAARVPFATTNGRLADSANMTFDGTYLKTKYQSSDGSAGITATITTAALTPGGTQGSMTFKDGVLVAQTQAT